MPSRSARKCSSCSGTGEVASEVGVLDCPDCGGSGVLPHPSVLVEWRARDIEKAHGFAKHTTAPDIRWLVTELRRARAALTEVVSLAQEPPSDEVLKQIRFTSGRALSIFDEQPAEQEG